MSLSFQRRIENKSYSKHLLTKSMNNVSLHLNACDKVFEPGLRLRPFELVMHRGTPRESEWKKPVNKSSNFSLKNSHQKIDGDVWLG